MFIYFPDDRDRRWKVEYCHFSYWNELDKRQFIECPSGEAVNMLESIYDQGTGDRQYRFGCTRVASSSTCSWTDYQNAFDDPVNIHCDGYIGGIESIHSNYHEDRRWKVQCCHLKEHIDKTGCKLTSYINDFNQKIEFKLQPDQMFVGLESYHDNSKE